MTSKVQTELYAETRLDSDSATSEPTWLLHQLEVYNWGPFSGFHQAEFDPVGTAIIGPTGSGKTTLVDALMTLLVSHPRYNLASTGGHESDRTLMSYVRGVLGGDGSDGGDDVSRSGKTVTGICATYRAGEETLRLGGLLWIDGNGTSTKDLKRRWIFSQAEDQSLEIWLRLLHEESVRELLRVGRETARHRIFDSKKAFLAHTRKFFDVGENAFTLLNRAAGLKQLNSIDEIFRELVLDDRSAFDRALQVAAEFDNLAGIHTELENARRQQSALEPVAAEHRKLLKAREKKKSLQTLKRILPIWFALTGKQLWEKSLEAINADSASKGSQLAEQKNLATQQKAHVDTVYKKYLELGGDAVGGLEETIKLLKERVVDRQKHAAQYLQAIRVFQLDEALTPSALQQNQLVLSEKHQEVGQQFEAAEKETLDAKSGQRDVEKRVAEVSQLLEKVRSRPGSNIPPRHHDFRADLANELSMNESELPFLAELVEVKPTDTQWRGAIERAIGSARLQILVPEKRMSAALRWVNGRDNRLHVRLQSASKNVSHREFFNDGFTQKLNFKQHSLIETAKDALARYDRRCVASADELRSTEHGLTIEGTMSGRKGKFEKQDQRRLNEGWMTGFDNKNQLESLGQQLDDLAESSKQLKEIFGECFAKQKTLEQQLSLIKQLSELEFATIDLPLAQSELMATEKRLTALLDPNSDTSRAKNEYDSANKQLADLQSAINELEQQLAVLKHRADEATDEIQKTETRIGKGLKEDESALADSSFAVDVDVYADVGPKELVDDERDASSKLDAQLKKHSQRVADHETRIVNLMGKAKAVDTGALAEVDAVLQDVDDYIERLRVLKEEALPEKLKRFLKYLNESSDQGVTQLLAGIREEVDLIEHRIAELNNTLLKVEFRSGRYLQLQPQRIKHERLRTLESAQRKLRSAALKDDEGESHYRALRELVAILREAGENRKQKGSRALLDPRYRLEFYVVEVDRQTGDQSPRRSGSQSGSGGEKELMASHILTASLSYALCPAGASRPLYGTVVLDEAFSKSSQSAATRIVKALRIFGLHPIFVTPNKEVGLLKRHTKRVICVQRPKKQSSLASISWEKLEGLSRLR